MKVAWAVSCFFNIIIFSCGTCFGMSDMLEEKKSEVRKNLFVIEISDFGINEKIREQLAFDIPGNAEIGLKNKKATIDLFTIKKINGCLKAKNTNFRDNLVVDGDLKVEGCFFEKNLSVGGPSTVLRTTQCDGILKIQPQLGNTKTVLIIDNFSWVGVVETNGSAQVTISDSEVTSLLIKDNNGPQSIVCLKDGTVVKDNITFENGRGVVYATDDVEIGGKINGGMLMPPWDGKKIIDLNNIK